MAGPWEKYGTDQSGPWSKYQKPEAPKREYTPSPYEFQLDISSPETESPVKQFLKGGAIGLRQTRMGLQGLFGQPSESDLAEQEAMKNYLERSGWGTAGKVVEQLPQYATATGLGPATMLGRGAMSGLTAMLTSPEDRAKEAALGAVGSIGGEQVVRLGSKVARGPMAQDFVAGLYEKGVRPTLAQALGGGWKEAEEKMTSLPFVGSVVQRAQKRALESFNTASVKEIINELNTGLMESGEGRNLIPAGANAITQEFTNIGKIEPGAKGLEQAYTAVSKVYDDLAENSQGSITPQLADSLTSAKESMYGIGEKAGKSFDGLFDQYIGSRIDPNGAISGRTMKEIDSDLTGLISDLKRGDSVDKNMAHAFEQIQSGFDSMMDQMNPGYQTIKRNADAAYRKLALLGKASTSSVGSELATPANLAQQLRAEDTSSWNKNFALNKSDWTDWARQNIELMGNKFPESGTAARSAMSDVAGSLGALQLNAIPEAMAIYGVSRAAWSPQVQDMLVRQAMKQPGPQRREVIKGLRKLIEPAGAVGASYATSR
jgi:hypothetical protein